MPLDTTNFHPQGPVKSVDMLQFYNLFTGMMTDQPVTLSNTLTVGGNQSVSTVPLRVYGAAGQNTSLVDAYPDKTQAQPGFGFSGLGRHSWGPSGSAAQDTFMSRIALQNGHVTDTPGLYITPGLELPSGSLNGSCLIDQSITAAKLATDVGGTVIHEEFLPANGTTVVTVSANPTGVIYVSRNGVVQSTTDGHYSVSIRVFTFSTAFDGTERVSISYSVGPVGSAGLVDQSVTNAKLAPDTARDNLLTNGGFEIWQRGNGAFTTSYGPDKWFLAPGGTLSVSANTANADGFGTCAAVTATGSGNLLYQYLQGLNEWAWIKGRAFSLSVRVNCNAANACRVGLFDNNTNTTTWSAYHTGGSTYQTLSIANVTCPSAASQLQARIGFDAACTAYIDNAMLVVGSVAADYAPLHPADDLARCLRYYEIIGETAGEINWAFYQGGVNNSAVFVPYKARKAVTPTVTKNGTWTVSNAGQPSIFNSGLSGLAMGASALGTGNCQVQNNGAGSNITAESNP